MKQQKYPGKGKGGGEEERGKSKKRDRIEVERLTLKHALTKICIRNNSQGSFRIVIILSDGPNFRDSSQKMATPA